MLAHELAVRRETTRREDHGRVRGARAAGRRSCACRRGERARRSRSRVEAHPARPGFPVALSDRAPSPSSHRDVVEPLEDDPLEDGSPSGALLTELFEARVAPDDAAREQHRAAGPCGLLAAHDLRARLARSPRPRGRPCPRRRSRVVTRQTSANPGLCSTYSTLDPVGPGDERRAGCSLRRRLVDLEFVLVEPPPRAVSSTESTSSARWLSSGRWGSAGGGAPSRVEVPAGELEPTRRSFEPARPRPRAVASDRERGARRGRGRRCRPDQTSSRRTSPAPRPRPSLARAEPRAARAGPTRHRDPAHGLDSLQDAGLARALRVEQGQLPFAWLAADEREGVGALDLVHAAHLAEECGQGCRARRPRERRGRSCSRAPDPHYPQRGVPANSHYPRRIRRSASDSMRSTSDASTAKACSTGLRRGMSTPARRSASSG